MLLFSLSLGALVGWFVSGRIMSNLILKVKTAPVQDCAPMLSGVFWVLFRCIASVEYSPWVYPIVLVMFCVYLTAGYILQHSGKNWNWSHELRGWLDHIPDGFTGDVGRTQSSDRHCRCSYRNDCSEKELARADRSYSH